MLEGMNKMLIELMSRMESGCTSSVTGLILGRGPIAYAKRMLKMEMPKFDGENVEGWFYKVKKYF